MTRERKAQVATWGVLAGVLAVVGVTRIGWQGVAAPIASWIAGARKPAATPQDTVYRMMDAARDGDVRSYLNCYTAQMETTLRQLVMEKGEAALADYIRTFNASVKGVAIQEPDFVTEREVRLRVEFVYGDRNETQLYYLRQSTGEWRIARQENTEGAKVLVPYGTPVE
jgi:hypothetical protein